MSNKYYYGGLVTVVIALGGLQISANNKVEEELESSNLLHQEKALITVVPVENMTKLKQINVVKNSKPATDIHNKEEINTLWNDVMASLVDGREINLNNENDLIAYLQANDSDVIYNTIMKKLHGNDIPADKLSVYQQYLFSLLVVINTPRSISLFLSALDTVTMADSSAIYSTKQAINKIGRSPQYVDLVQTYFISFDNENIFLNDLSDVIARNAQSDNLRFLFDYIDSEDKFRKQAVTNSLKLLNNERLVPDLISYLESEDTTKGKQQATVYVLSNMGQYEAASALIQWSAKQPLSEKESLEISFKTALARSPSTQRAIMKELDRYQFQSTEIKEMISKLNTASDD